ncbi:hypothetical protein [Leptospira biflexa]|uniref:hypothetical protein n=1 Tax=Leptospira biflexa TaxID=172 RepID=UPI001082B801|nr:hypothetical protein [Leptospira biflexa]TGM38167.1 hypothetical protein EHQ80_11460 [Leptospira biflexa]TGM41498.1 hypothetical protein EHQ89_06025 [Leptospira biflexa]
MLLGDRVYHLQFSFEDKIFHIVRETWEDFRFQYGVIENRNIEFYEWNLSESAKQTLRQKWNELYLVQETHIQNQKNLEEDWEWTNQEKTKEYFQNKITGFGYFTKIEDPNSPIPKLFSFQKKDFISIKNDINRLLNGPTEVDRINVTTLPDTSSPFRLIANIETDTNRLIQNERKYFVRQFLVNPVLLYDQAFVKLEGKQFSLTLDEVKLWKLYRSKLVSELKFCILENECKDWEEMTLLLRILYLQKSIEEGQIVFPKKNFTGFSYLEFTEIPVSILNTKQKEYDQILIEKRKEFGKGYHPIHFYNWESFLSRYQSFIEGKSFTEGVEFNLEGKNPYPWNINPNIQSGSKDETANREKQWKTYTKNIQDLYSYHLVLQNCTNELFHYLNLMFPNGKIGDEIFWTPLTNNVFGLNFIPSVAALKIDLRSDKKNYKFYPSYRNLKRNQIKDWTEKNITERFVPTSKIYSQNPMDHSFLFFTEESVWSRPIFGLANAIWGLGYTGIGVLKSPMDKGKDFGKGTESIFYSLPELFFFNIRKGHFPFLTAEEIPEEYYEIESQ